ncbi:MAG: class I SAM-dependent methyltransferase [Candidatus Pacebacteria bacterium]|nr:class I SAM-dependent methyltransferase [Candidatus Paceibacterota bacterium]MCF7863071.1 class I SAM-dependent methyltransferase [Candidatus Paceibacterota bacterium]
MDEGHLHITMAPEEGEEQLSLKFPEDENILGLNQMAVRIAAIRSITDIPFAEKIYAVLKKDTGIEISDESVGADANTYSFVQLEARFKLINIIINERGFKNIFEIGSGYDTRGLIYAQDPNNTVVELDLKDVISKKEEIIKEANINKPDNLKLKNGDALNRKDFETIFKLFPENEPIVIVTEGLLRYFTLEDKKRIVENIKYILEKNPDSMWITSDLCINNFMIEKLPKEKVEAFDKINYPFKDEEESLKFYTDMGFVSEIRPTKNEPFLALSYAKKGLNQEIASKAWNSVEILCLKLKND